MRGLVALICLGLQSGVIRRGQCPCWKIWRVQSASTSGSTNLNAGAIVDSSKNGVVQEHQQEQHSDANSNNEDPSYGIFKFQIKSRVL